VAQLIESATVSQTVLNGTYNYYVKALGSVTLFQPNATGNFTFNISADGAQLLDSYMAVGQSITVTLLTTQGATAYYQTAFQIDGVSVTPKWFNGAPSSGNPSGIDSYTYSIIKTASVTWTVLASRTRYL
jgi:hypothetical protein